MKLSAFYCASTLFLGAAARPLVIVATARLLKRATIDPTLVPDFGIVAGTDPFGNGNCAGVTNPAGQVVQVPCTCPPSRDSFIANLTVNVAAGRVVNNPNVMIASFPTDSSVASRIARIQACIVTLQNLHGIGIGCPAASTTFLAQLKALQAQQDGAPASTSTAAPSDPSTTSTASDSTSTASSATTYSIAYTTILTPDGAATTSSESTATPAATTTDATASSSDGATTTTPSSASATPSTALTNGSIDPSLVPDFGIVAGTSPFGNGNCAGVTNPAGQIVQVPCTCPPSRESFIANLTLNVLAGHVVNNPNVAVSSFPTDSSAASQIARIQACLVTLQNLHGVGIGCPAASTTFSAQLKALQAQLDGAPASTSSVPAASASGTSSSTDSSASTTTSDSAAATSTDTTDSAASAASTTTTDNPASGTSTTTDSTTATITTSSGTSDSSSAASSTTTDSTSAASTQSGAAPASSATGPPSDADIASLAPFLGWSAGINPKPPANADCDGAVEDPNGGQIQVPCSCPPDDSIYIPALQANVHAGFAVNNTVVAVSFPVSNSTTDQLARLHAATVTLQNLDGPGKGCPNSATTFGAQVKALQAQLAAS